MRKLFLLLFVFALTGCVEQSANDYDEINKKMASLEEMIEDLQFQVNELEQIKDEQHSLMMQYTMLEEHYNYLANQVYTMENVLHATTEFDYVILNNVELSGENIIFHVIYTDFVIDDEAPNGFRLDYKGEEVTVTIYKEVPIYAMQDPGTWIIIEHSELVERPYGLFKLFKKDGEIVLVKEKYIP